MKRQMAWMVVCGWLACGTWGLRAAAAEDPAHNELRALRTRILDAITKGDFDAVLQNVHTNVVVTWQNNEVCRGHAGLREFFDRTGKGTFKGYKVPPTPDELTLFHGPNNGVSFGETVASYHVLGKEFEFKSRWTATLVKQDDRWLLASYHLSINVLDNALLRAARDGLLLAAGAALIGGLIVGVFLGKRRAAKSR
jgi:ketosteroid isomerase-like protein